MCPELIEMWPLSVRDGKGGACTRMLPAHPIRPIGRIRDEIMEIDGVLREPRSIKHTPDIVRKRDQSGDEGVIPNCIATSVSRAGRRPPRAAYCFQAAKLRTNEKKVNTASNHAQISIVKNHAPVSKIKNVVRAARTIVSHRF